MEVVNAALIEADRVARALTKTECEVLTSSCGVFPLASMAFAIQTATPVPVLGRP